MTSSLKPLLAPLPTDYPVTNNQGAALFEQPTWSIGPICGCFGMQDSGLDCCCANCCIAWYTWGNALHYMGVGSTFATLSAAAATIDYGDTPAGEAASALARANAALSGQQKRRELVQALGLYREGDEGFILRCCCMPCVQCQEVDTVFSFYRDSLGYTDLQYGSCWRCQCTRWYSSMGGDYVSLTNRTQPGLRVVPFPDQIFRGESVGPNYPKDDLPHGYFFDQGIPKPNLTAKTAPLPDQPPAYNPLLPGYAQPRRAVK